MKKKVLSGMVALAIVLQSCLALPVFAENEARDPNLILNIDGAASRAVDFADNYGADLTAAEVESLAEDYVSNYLLYNNSIGRVMYMTNYRLSCVDSDVFDSYYYTIERNDDGSVVKNENGNVQKTVSEFYTEHSDHNGEHMYAATFIKNDIDVYGYLIDATKKAGAEAWLSVRMNDHHQTNYTWYNNYVGNQAQYCIDMANGNYNLDFTEEAVQDYYKDYIVELCTNYDIDGIELDWLRSPGVLPEVNETNIQIINDYMAEIRAAVNEVNEAQNKTIEISARTYADEKHSLNVGFDAAQWIADGSIDLLTVMNWYTPTNFDIPVEEWRASIDDRNVSKNEYALVAGSDVAISNGIGVETRLTPEHLKGFASMAYGRGSDGVYLFNYSYKFDGVVVDVAEDGTATSTNKMTEKFQAITSKEIAETGLRRYAYTSKSDNAKVYPVSIEAGSSASINMYTGTAPSEGYYQVMVGVNTEDEANKLSVTVNGGETIQGADAPTSQQYPYTGTGLVNHIAQMAPRVMSFRVSNSDVLKDGYNTIEITNNSNETQEILWLEVYADNSEIIPYTFKELSNVQLKDENGDDVKATKAIQVAQVGLKTIAYVGQENDGMYVYDITDETKPVLIQYIPVSHAFKETGKIDYMKYGNDQYIIYVTGVWGGNADRYAAKIKADGKLDVDNKIKVAYNGGYRSMVKVIDNCVIASGDSSVTLSQFNGTSFSEKTIITLNLDGAYSCSTGGFDARLINDELYVMIGTQEKVTSEDTDNKYYLEMYKGKIDSTEGFTRIFRQEAGNQKEILSVSFMDDCSVLVAVAAENNNNGKGIIKVDFTDTEMTQTVVASENKGLTTTRLSDRYIAYGAQYGGSGKLSLYSKNHGIVKTLDYASPPQMFATFNGKLYTVTSAGLLYVHQYGTSKEPPYEDIISYDLEKLGTATLYNSNNVQLTISKSLAVTEIGDKTFAYVGKENPGTNSEENPGGIYVYDITNIDSPVLKQYITHMGNFDVSKTFPMPHKLDLLESGNEKYLLYTTEGTNKSDRCASKINADGTVDTTTTTKIEYMGGYFSSIKTAGKYVLVSGGNWSGYEAVMLMEFNGTNFVGKASINLDDESTKYSVSQFGVNVVGNDMYILVGKYDSNGKDYLELHKANLNADEITFTEIACQEAVNQNDATSVSFIDDTSALVTVSDVNNPEGKGIIRIDFTDNSMTQTLIATGNSGKSSISLGDGYAVYGSQIWGNGNVSLYNKDGGIDETLSCAAVPNQIVICNDKVYAVSSGAIDVFSYKLDVKCDGNILSGGKITGKMTGYKNGDSITLTVKGKDYTATVNADGSFECTVEGLSLGDVVDAVVTVVRDDEIVVLKTVEGLGYYGDSITVTIGELKNSTGAVVTEFEAGAMTLDVNIISPETGAKKAILALYEGDTFKAVDIVDISKNIEDVPFEFTVENADAAKAKVFVWDDDMITPLTGVTLVGAISENF